MSTTPTIDLLLDTAILLPGATINGRLVVDIVGRAFSFTGAYVQLTGKEFAHLTMGSGRRSITMPTWFTHVDVRRTLYGVSKESAREGGGAVLNPGHYEFPFSITLPLDAPPTYGWDVYKCGSRLKYKLRGVLSVPYCQSLHIERVMTVLPTVPYAQAAATTQAQVQSAGIQLVPLMRNMGMSKSKTQYAQVEVQLNPTVVVLGGKMAELYYEEQRQVAAGAHGQAVTGVQLGVADNDSDDDETANVQKAKAASDALASTGAQANTYDDHSDNQEDSTGRTCGVAYNEASAAQDTNNSHNTNSSLSHRDERRNRRAQRREERRPHRGLFGRALQLYNGVTGNSTASHADTTPVPSATRTVDTASPLSNANPTGPVVYLSVRVLVQNMTREPIQAITVSLRQLREVRVLKVTRGDKTTLSAVTVELEGGRGCAPGASSSVDVKLPLLQNMHYYLSQQERQYGMNEAEQRLPLPTLKTGNFSCETFVEVTFPKNTMHTEMGRFPGCVQVVEVVGAPGVPNITVPATFARAIVDVE